MSAPTPPGSGLYVIQIFCAAGLIATCAAIIGLGAALALRYQDWLLILPTGAVGILAAFAAVTIILELAGLGRAGKEAS